MGSSISHYDLKEYFKGLEGTKEIGEKLEILRNNRNEADYKLHFNEKKVEDSKNKSKEILDFFKKEFWCDNNA